MTTGWMAERFAREERLSGLDHYLNAPSPEEQAELQAQTDAAEMTRWALAHGLEIVDIDE